jgi:hypothetical protein
MRLGQPSPDPGLGVAIEMLGRHTGYVGNVVIIGQGLSGESFAPKDPPPLLDQVEPRRSHRYEGMFRDTIQRL